MKNIFHHLICLIALEQLIGLFAFRCGSIKISYQVRIERSS